MKEGLCEVTVINTSSLNIVGTSGATERLSIWDMPANPVIIPDYDSCPLLNTPNCYVTKKSQERIVDIWFA